MPPKASKAAKEKIAVDKTFGMKNKNKSKVVQKYIKQITSSVQGQRNGQTDAEQKVKDNKQKEVAKAALMNSLFNMGTDKKGRAFDPVAKKKAKEEEANAVAAGKKLADDIRKDIIEGIANTIRLTNPKNGIRNSELGGHPIILALKDKHAETFKHLQALLFIKANDKVFWVDDVESSNPLIRCLADVEAEVGADERPIEEIIEERRAALPPGGTPVTLESFLAWKDRREALRLAQVEEESKEASKKAGKIVGMSGKDLFTFDASLFVDDAEAVEADVYDDRSEVADDEGDGLTKGVEVDDGDDVAGDENPGAASSSGANENPS